MTDDTPLTYDQFTSSYPAVSYREGRIVIYPSDELTHALFLESGKIRKYSMTRFGEKSTMNIFVAPSLFPLSSVLNGTPNAYYFEAMTPVVMRKIPLHEAAGYIKDRPGVAYDLLQKVYEGLELTQQRIIYLMRGSIRCRVVFELIIEARRSGVVQIDGSFIITMSESEIAERAGLSRETVSRELAKIFKMDGLCTRQGRSIVIHDLQTLETLLQKSI